MSKLDFVAGMSVCLFCQKGNLYEAEENLLPKILESQLIAVCQNHFPNDFSRVDWDTPLHDGPIFCYWCFDNASKLSKLSKRLTEIQDKIEILVRQMTIYISCEQERQKVIVSTKSKNPNLVPVTSTQSVVEKGSCVPLQDYVMDFSIYDDDEDEETENLHESMDSTDPLLLHEAGANCIKNEVQTDPTDNFSFLETVPVNSSRKEVTNSKRELTTAGETVIVAGTSTEKNGNHISTYNQSKSRKRALISEDSEFKCNKCGKTFSWFRTLRKHDCKKATVECEMCGKSFTASYIDDHRLLHTIHTGKNGRRSYNCSICGEHFILKTEWMAHMETNHLESLPYKCDICNLRFMFLTQWRNHDKDHASEREVFKCAICGIGFKCSQLVKQHFRQMHEKFKCPACEIYCQDDAHFRAHLQSHREDSLY